MYTCGMSTADHTVLPEALADALPQLVRELDGWEAERARLVALIERRKTLINAIRAEITQPELSDVGPRVIPDRDLPVQGERGVTARQAVLAVLGDAIGPLTTREIVDVAFARGLRPTVENPESAISASLSYLAKKGKVTRQFKGSRLAWALATASQQLAVEAGATR